ncbi:MAG: chemotaxis protein CheW [Proteobacteria bacterium]|nr:chemotaxis protein CheW [Pseudomonadota bacterium]MBU1740919.1 chemotaxis protein CheW [Pseudomonadota bacterium]
MVYAEEHTPGNLNGRHQVQTYGDTAQMVTFLLAGEEFALDIRHVREINRMMKVTPVPQAPGAVEGVINLRGQVVPVVNMRREFNLPDKENDRQTRIVVVEIEDHTVGFVVDAVSEVLRIPESSFEPPPPMVSGLESEMISAVGKLEDRLLIVLNLRRVVDRAAETVSLVQ